MGSSKNPPSRTSRPDIPPPRPTRRNVDRPRKSQPGAVAHPLDSTVATAAPTMPSVVPPSTAALPGGAPPPEAMIDAFSFESKPTLLTRATSVSLPRPDRVRVPASITPPRPRSGVPATAANAADAKAIALAQAKRTARSRRGLAMTRLTEELPGETLASRYHVDELIGRGSMGAIFAATDTRAPDGRPARVALKVLDPDLVHDTAAVARFRTEALAPDRIGSKHVVQVYEADVSTELLDLLRGFDPESGDYRVTEGVPYMVMEMLYGVDLREHLRAVGPLRATEVVALLSQVGITLDAAHEHGIVHRDLKPANLFLTRAPDGSELIKVLDFGVAQLAPTSAPSALGGASPSSGAAGGQDAGFFGTPWYMAPEQVKGGPVGPEVDLWALTLIAFRLLTGESYWAPCPLPELIGLIIEGPKTAPSAVIVERHVVLRASVGPRFDAWFMTGCAVDPKARFASGAEAIQALEKALREDAS